MTINQKEQYLVVARDYKEGTHKFWQLDSLVIIDDVTSEI